MASSSRSDVWQYIKKTSDKHVYCSLCSRKLAYHGGTTNLRNHLIRVHGDTYRPAKETTTQQTLETVTRKCSESRSKIISELLVDVVTMDLRPIAIVEGEGMRRLLLYLEPGYRIPSRKHIGKLLLKKYENAVAVLKNKLAQDVVAMSLTSDIWTSNAMEAYMSVTAHFITPGWEIQSCVLATKPFPERHTGRNIADSTVQVTRSFNIGDEKVKAVVHDTAANAELSGKIMSESFGWENVDCAAHKLQLAVNEGLQIATIARAIAAGRKLVGHFKHSALATAELKLRQAQMKLPEKKLIQDCPTRWNSTFFMAERLLANRWPVSAVLSDESVTKRQDRALDLRNDQWELLQELVKPLELLQTATTFLSQETNVSGSCVYPVIHGLITNLNTAEEDLPAIRNFKVVVATALERRWSFDDIDLTSSPALLSALDPRFRGLKFLSDCEKESMKAYLLQLLEKDSDQSQTQEKEKERPVARETKPLIW